MRLDDDNADAADNLVRTAKQLAGASLTKETRPQVFLGYLPAAV